MIALCRCKALYFTTILYPNYYKRIYMRYDVHANLSITTT